MFDNRNIRDIDTTYEMKKGGNTVYEIIAAYRQATLHILNVGSNLTQPFWDFSIFNKNDNYEKNIICSIYIRNFSFLQ